MPFPREQALSEGRALVEGGDLDLERSHRLYTAYTSTDWPHGDDELIIATMIAEAEDPLEDNELGPILAGWNKGDTGVAQRT